MICILPYHRGPQGPLNEIHHDRQTYRVQYLYIMILLHDAFRIGLVISPRVAVLA